MNIDHLYYFLVIADTKSINKAARELFISQQHLSRIVNALESELRTQLLTRNSTGIELTAKGEVFLQFAEKIVTDYRDMQSYFYLDALPPLEQEQLISGSCKITFPFFFSLFLNDFIQKLGASYPAISIKCFENDHNYTLEELYQSDMLHLLLDTPDQNLVNPEEKLVFYHIGDTTASFCVNSASPLARKHLLTQEDIASQLQTSYVQNNYISTNSDVLFTSSNIYQHLDSVIHNQSICVVPAYIRSDIYAAYPDIVLLPYEKQLSIPIHLVHSRRHVLNNADKAVMRFVTQYIQKINQLD